MITAMRRAFSIPELRAKIAFTLALLAVCRLGVYISVPGINADLAVTMFQYASGGGQNLFQLADIFTGGAFAKMTIFALGVMPYISASIILQILMVALPSLQREIRESPDQGRRKLSRWTRVTTLFLAVIESTFFARFALHQLNAATPGIVLQQLIDIQIFGVSWLYYFLFVLTMTTGTLLLMWIGEQISEKGIGNGISLIIASGIFASFPSAIGSVIKQLQLETQEAGQLNFFTVTVLACLFVIIILGTILVIQGQRRIPLQYARRIVGRHEVQGSGNSYLPLRVNYAGVVPVIFAATFLMFPATVGQFLGKQNWFGQLAAYLYPGSWTYLFLYVLLIICFTYFWTHTQFKPEQIAGDMKRNGAFIPGIRQGRPTQEFLEQTMSRITLAGAVFLAVIAILPTLVGRVMGIDARISQLFGGTSLLILVGVILDTAKQIDSHLLMKRYEGFMKKKGY